MRHYANIMRPTDAEATRGEREGTDTVYIKEWPFSYKQLSGSVSEEVHSSWGNSAGQLEGFADPSRQVTPGFFLTGGSLGERRLDIVAVEDKDGMGRKWVITYSEAIGGNG